MTLTSFALIQGAYAVPSNLGESLIEYQAILNSSLLQSTLSQSEFIVDIKRTTRNISTATTVRYFIRTLGNGYGNTLFDAEEEEYGMDDDYAFDNEKEYGMDDEWAFSDLSDDDDENLTDGNKDSKSFDRNGRERKYIAKLLLTPNPQLGPPIVTVVSIKRI